MSLQDEVRTASKSKAEVENEQYQEDFEYGVLKADLCIRDLKEQFLNMANHGEYDEDVNGEKCIHLFYSGSMREGIARDMGLECQLEDRSVDGKIYTTYTYVKYEVVKPGIYKGFMHRMLEFSEKENVSFEILCRCNLYGTEYEFEPVAGRTMKGSVAKYNLVCGIDCNMKY